MHGHAEHLLTKCVRCPGWAPRWATAINDAEEPVCTPHAIETIADLTGAPA